MTQQQQTKNKKGFTPPKGRPTRARNEVGARHKAFGPTAQWVAVSFLILLLLVLLVVLSDGGDFNPFNGDQIGALVGAAAIVRA